jgi:hypothetical protein
MKTASASAPKPALRAGQATTAKGFYSWIDATPAAELREVRTLLVVGAGPDGAARMRREAGGFLDPRRGNFTDKLNVPAWCGGAARFAADCREAVTRVDARLAGRSLPAPATAGPVTPKATAPAAKAAVAPVAPKAPTSPAKPLFGLARVIDALNREMKGGK